MFDVSKLIISVAKIKRPRYKFVNHHRIKIEDFDVLERENGQGLEDLKYPDEDEKKWELVDKELNILNILWQEEINPVKKKILSLKYKLALEIFDYEIRNEKDYKKKEDKIKEDLETENLIKVLSQQLKNLEQKLSIEN